MHKFEISYKINGKEEVYMCMSDTENEAWWNFHEFVSEILEAEMNGR